MLNGSCVFVLKVRFVFVLKEKCVFVLEGRYVCLKGYMCVCF